MSVVKGRESIKEAYRDEDRAAAYIKGRFDDPFGAEVHRRQATCINREIRRVGPSRLLEVACGPARLTTELEQVETSVAVEQSPAMLVHARQRLKEAGRTHWTLLQRDAFDLQLPVDSFDMVVTFRFLRHFNVADRKRLFEQIRRVLAPSGYVICDVASMVAYKWLLRKWGVDGSWVDDYWFTRDEFIREMRAESFVVEAMYPVHSLVHLQYYLFAYLHGRMPRTATRMSRALTSLVAHDAYEWVAVCRRA
jgi:ubiquinone/menaquinone biosynthesis C-methylase UbiE